MTPPRAKIAPNTTRTTTRTADQRGTCSPHGTRRFCRIRTGGSSMKLRIQARAIGIKTSRARYKIATTITEIKMVLSVDDDEFTALSSISTANYHSLTANKPARRPRRARPHWDKSDWIVLELGRRFARGIP